MIAYCLFCETKKAATIAYILEKRGIGRAFSPQIINRQRTAGVNEEKLYALLPGYIFVFTKEELNPTLAFRGVEGIIRRLGRAEDGFCLQYSDYEFAMQLYEMDGIVGQIKLFKEGEQIVIADSLFKRVKGNVLKVDYKKQRARVEFEFAGIICTTWVAFEMIDNASSLP